ncbi:YjbH domain-containing protein [Hydrogenovibrio sp. SC-1]|uniref:YjbH domain-containing protein n=1 Tax=Hydrogenovibrio sp. SC-1 TaxID=2065820 RepID=UPI00117A8A27|nr:YjbH domain-containing protein [Hydrogenovibrio sp. SC-1]
MLSPTVFASTFSDFYGIDLLDGTGMTVNGTTGLIMVPTAQLIRHGTLAGTFNSFTRPGAPADAEAENYYLSAGVWRGLEVQFGLNELHAKGANPNAYGDFYNRDLVGNFKYGIKMSGQWRLAIGGQDVMGLAIQNQRLYGVVTHASRYLATTVGYAVKGKSSGVSQHLTGLFAGGEVYLPYNVSVLMDYDGVATRGGLRGRLHNIAGTHLQLNLDTMLASTQAGESISFGMTISYPLGGGAKAKLEALTDARYRQSSPYSSRHSLSDLPNFKNYSSNSLPSASANKTQISHSESSADKVVPLDRPLNLKALKDRLMAAGLEHIALKVDEDTSILRLRYQNRLYDLNQFDGLAQAIAIVAPFANQYDLLNLEIEILNQQIPMMSVKLGTAWALGQLQKHHSKAAYYLPEFNRIEWTAEPTWQADVTGGRSEWLSLKMEPYIVSTIGSEIGVYQQSLGLLSELSAPLWQGASAHISRIDPLYNSYHFRPGGFLEDSRVVSQWKELSFSQTWVPIDGLVNVFSYQLALNEGDKTDHMINSTRYYFGEGRHQVYGNWSRHMGNTPLATTGLNDWSGDYYGYEYYWPEQGMGAFIERGVYLNQDLTTKLAFKSYLGDSQLQATLMRSDTGYEKVRLNLTIPFTTKRAAKLGALTIRGENKWSYGIETIISDPDNTGVNLNLGDVRYVNFGAETKQPVILDQHFMDSGRFTPAYMRTHIHQLNQRIKRILYQTVD